ncbi:MAG: BMP family ABC transporter substrate-binding protein [Bacillota bacterium]|nr:BMP family ABC transporter substrate-binding protein [Bacillota bacterium]
MKKNYRILSLLLVLFLMAGIMTGCVKKTDDAQTSGQPTGSGSTTASTTATGNLKPGEGSKKIGIIMGGSKDDYGFNYAFAQLADQVQKELGIEAVIKENVPTTSDFEGVCEELISQGCKIIFPSQFGYLEYAHNVAQRHPDVAFYSFPITDYNGGNFSTIHGNAHEPWYINGALAAMYSKTGKVGFIGSLPIPDVIVSVDAFTLGAQSINPKIQVSAVFTGSWADTGLQTTATNQLLDSGCDVIAPFQDSVKTVIEICASRGAHAFGCNADAYSLDPKTWLSACITDWSGYIPYIKAAIDGKYENVNLSGGFKEHFITNAKYGDTVTPDMVTKLTEIRKKIESGDIYVFQGPVYDQSGAVMFKDGYRPTIQEINLVNKLVKGVTGKLN